MPRLRSASASLSLPRRHVAVGDAIDVYSAGGRRSRKGRGGQAKGAAAAIRARGKRVADVIELDGSDSDDVKSAPCRGTNEEISNGKESEGKVSEEEIRRGSSEDDDGKLASRSRRSKCLQKELTEEDISNGQEESKAEVSEEASQSAFEDDNRRLAPHRKLERPQNRSAFEEISNGEESEADVFEISPSTSEDDEMKLAPRRRSKRLREKLRTEDLNGEESEDEEIRQSSFNDDDESLAPRRRSKRLWKKLRAEDVLNGENESKAVDDDRKLTPCRRSKRLHEKLKAGDVSNESHSETSCSSMLSACSTSDDEFLGNAVKAGLSSSSELLCSVCKTGAASNLFTECHNSDCFRSFHNFCLDPPLQDIEGNWACSFCKVHQVSLSKSTQEKQPHMKKIQTIVGHRRVNLQKSDFQYQFLVKWESLSHHHDCWVPLEWLYIFDRVRVLSYRKKYPLLKETYSEDQRKPEWFEVDRVIACRRKSNPNDSCDILSTLWDKQGCGEYEFLVKWKGLDYCEATWESSCTDGVLAGVSKLVQRHQCSSKRAENVSPTTLSYLDGKIPEEIHSGSLYEYQLQGLQWILTNFKARRNIILADEMGLGKTVQVVCFLHHIIKERFTISPALVIAPKSTLLQWEKEFRCWGRDLNVIVYQGSKESRKCIQIHEMYSSDGKTLFDALVTSYEFVQLDRAVLRMFKWSTIVIDEAQRMKKLDCNLATCLKQYSSEFRLLLTGTPLQNTLLELFALLHYIDPDEFSDPNGEAESFSSIKAGRQDSNLEDKVAQLHEILKPRMLRRMKSDVLPDSIPTKKWVEVPCVLTDSQRELYINILEKNYSKLNDAIQSGRKIALNCVLMELKKCCNHPYLFPGQEVRQQSEEAAFLSLVAASGKLQLLEKLLPRMKERGNRVLIFSQMTKMLDILEDFLSFLGYKFSRIDGQTSLSARQESIKEYNNLESEIFIFLMSTRAGGLGVDLPGADRVIIYDPDFNPFMDLQAQSRAHRIGQTRPVVVYQLITKCSVEEKILQKSKQKLAIENIVMNSSKKPSGDELQSILLHGAKTIVDRKKVNATSIHYDEEAIENLLKLDPAPGEKCFSDDNGYLGSIVSFSHGVEKEEPLSPKAEDLKEVLGPLIPEVAVDLGRGKRQKKAVNYTDENSDSDDMYAPESSLATGSSSTDDETDNLEPEVASQLDS